MLDVKEDLSQKYTRDATVSDLCSLRPGEEGEGWGEENGGLKLRAHLVGDLGPLDGLDRGGLSKQEERDECREGEENDVADREEGGHRVAVE